MNLFNQQITLSINSVILIIAAIVVLLLIGVIVFLLVKQRKAQKSLQPKYGFLGKSLYATLTVLILGGGLIFGVLSLRESKVFDVEAKKTMSVDIMTNKLLTDGDYTYIDLKMIPTVDGEVWGKSGDQFTVYWTLNGDNGETYTYIEQNKNDTERSGLQKYFLKGNYDITVVVIFDNTTYTFTKQASF